MKSKVVRKPYRKNANGFLAYLEFFIESGKSSASIMKSNEL